MSEPIVSIIICTCNRAAHLRQTLAALAGLCVPEALPTELIVVDNASTDDTAQVVQQCRLPNMPVRYIQEPKRGQCFARNTGIATAKGEIILFTDDDVRPPQNWIAGMCGPILQGEADAVAGGVKIAPHLEREWMKHEHRCWLACTDWIETPVAQSMVGANMAFSKAVLTKVSGFDTELGPGALGFYDETLFAWQLKEAGFRIAAALDLAVDHHFEVSRLQRRNFQATAEKYGRSSAYVAYHWEHRDVTRSMLKFLKRRLRLLFWRTQNRQKRLAPDGMDWWEFELIKEANFFRHYARLQGQPRNYAKRGLEKLRHG